MASKTSGKNNPRTIFGWCMYDWANSAYITTAIGLLPVYFARSVVGSEGVVLGGTLYKAETLWASVVGLATLLTFLTAPVLGAIADFSATKKKFLLTFAYTGALFTMLLYFCRSGDVLQTLAFFLITQISFISANVFYDAFLPQIASDDKLDWISGKGYAFGYLGGGLQFALALALMAGHEKVGLSLTAASRIGIVSAGLWWAGFTLFTVRYLREAPLAGALPNRQQDRLRWWAYAAVGVSRTVATLRKVGRLRQLALFLLAFFFYDDAIQTVIYMATIYGSEELQLSAVPLMLTVLMIQGVATLGSLVFSRLAGRIGTKRTLTLTLVFWSSIVVCAYFLRTATQYFLLGAAVGLILGGSQALSRSLYSSMIPEQASAEFYGFYTVFSKLGAVLGPWTFALIKQATGSSRLAIVSLIVLFLSGLTLLHFVDEKKARATKLAAGF